MAGRVVIALATDLLRRGLQTVTPGRQARDGSPSHVLFAIARALAKAIEGKKPDLGVAIFDAEVDATSLAETSQHERLPALVEALGLVPVHAPSPEHLAASYHRAALEAGYDVIVLGSDKRLAQLVGERCWWYDLYKDVRYTPDRVRKRFEVGPDRVDQWLALVGDDDVLPGVKGLGKKSAAQIIESYGSVHDAIAQADTVEGRAGKALRASLDEARRQLARAKLDDSRPLPVPLDALAHRPASSDARQKLYAELGFLELLTAAATAPELDVVLCCGPEAVERELARLSSAPVSLQGLIEDPSPPRGDLAGLGLVQGDLALYLPLAGEGDTLEDIPARLIEWLEDASVAKGGHDVKTLAVALLRRGIALRGVVTDSCCLSHLHEPSNLAPHDLEVVAPQVLHRAVPEEDGVRGRGRRRKPWSAIATGRAGRFACLHAEAAAAVGRALEPTATPSTLEEYLALSDTLVRMEHRGIACDRDDLEETGRVFDERAASWEAEAHDLAGRAFNVNSTKQLGELLFGELGLTVVKKTKTGWSTATDALERIRHEHPIVPLVIRYRTLRRLTDAWVTGLQAHIGQDGRVHATMHHARSFSGRIICSTPDLGRVPGKTEDMARIRHAFGAAPGHRIVAIDYRQLGLYVLAHLTGDPALVEPLRAGADMHRLTAAAVLDEPPEAITEEDRQLGKVINFATFAGQGMSALALELGVSAAEAKTFLDRFDQRYAVVRAFQDDQLRLVSERGHVVTLAGRRWPIGGLDSPDAMMRGYAERLARRATHEGSVADVSRRGLLRADQALRAAGLSAAPLLQVHDEVLFEVPEREVERAAAIAAEAMRSAYDLRVPLRVEVETGPNWAELEPLA